VILLSIIFFTGIFPVSISRGTGEVGYEFNLKWPTDTEDYFDHPIGVAVDSSGNVYVADSLNDRIQKLSSNGELIVEWGERGSGDGQFNSTCDVAVDSSGNVYVSDSLNNRIQKFTSNGQFITKWGKTGSENGQFWYPGGIAVDSSGIVYVADEGNNRIQKFTSNGTFIAKWGSEGSGDGEFDEPLGVGVDGFNNVYVADNFNYRVQKFASNGTFITKFEIPEAVARFRAPNDVDVDAFGNLFVSCGSSNIIVKFSPTGTLLTKVNSTEFWCGKWGQTAGVAVDGSGNVYVSNVFHDRIHKFDPNGNLVAIWGQYLDGQFNLIWGLAVDGSGNIYVADTCNNRVQKFTSDGTFMTKWGSEGTGDGQFDYPIGVAVDSSGNVYVVDEGNNRIQKFTSNGQFITKWGGKGVPGLVDKTEGDGLFYDPWGIAVDKFDNVYVADLLNYRVQKFTSDGTFIGKWGESGYGNGTFIAPDCIAVDSLGYVYVGDSSRIQKFTSDGVFVTTWGNPNPQPYDIPPLFDPWGVAIDGEGYVYIADGFYDSVQKWTSNGTLVAKWGSEGEGDGQFFHSSAVAVDALGNVYVSDNLRVQKFVPVFTGSLKVAVRGGDNVPVSGVNVTSIVQPSGQSALSGITGIDGSILFDDVKPGTYTIQASKKKYLSTSLTIEVVANGSAKASITLQAQAPTTGDLSVTVKDTNGNPVPGVSVSSTVQPGGQSALGGTTGTDGVIVFNSVLPGSYTLQASKSGYVSKSEQLNVIAGTVNRVSVTLQAQSSSPGGGIPGFPYAAVAMGILVSTILMRLRASKNNIRIRST
jgi:sugar lactone lactonase YvrE